MSEYDDWSARTHHTHSERPVLTMLPRDLFVCLSEISFASSFSIVAANTTACKLVVNLIILPITAMFRQPEIQYVHEERQLHCTNGMNANIVMIKNDNDSLHFFTSGFRMIQCL